MSNKNIYYVSIIILISTILGCKNNQIAEKVADISFFEKDQIKCRTDPSKDGCRMDFNYKQEKISFTFLRDYNIDANQITIGKVGFQENPATIFFYEQVLSNKSHLHFPFNVFINFIRKLTVFYSNDLNTIDIEIHNGSEEIIYNELKEFTKNHNLKEDEAYLNTIEPSKFHYSDLEQLKFISEDLSVLEAFLLELSIKNKENMKI